MTILLDPIRRQYHEKSTEDLTNEITAAKNISQYLDDNGEEFLETPLHIHLRNLLAETEMSIAQITARSAKGDYVYQIFRGIKNPSRDVLLCIALALGLDLPKTEHLLRIARMPSLDARNRRDSVIMFAIDHTLSVADTNDILYRFELECL